MNKQQIESLQVQLYMQGYKGKDGKALSIDGQMGPNTAWAAQNMLRDKGYNLSVDGIWGTQSQNAYNNYSSKIYDSSLNREKPSSGMQNYTPAVNSQPKVNIGSSLVSSSAAAAQKQIYDSSVGKDWSGTVNQSYSSSPVQKKSYDSSVGKDWSGTVNQSYSSSPVQKKSYDSSVGKDWSGTVNQNYSSTKPQSSAKSGTSRAYESLVQNKWPIAAAEPKHSMGSTSSQKQQKDVIGEMLVKGLNELERILAAQSKEKAKLQPYESLVQNKWPTLGQQSGIGARSLPQSSGKQDYVSQQVEKNLTEVLLRADPKAQQVFTGREAIAEEQEKLNLLGFYGKNGKPLREDGILDQDTLLAWNDKTYGGVLLGSNNSPMAKAQREWEKGKNQDFENNSFGPTPLPFLEKEWVKQGQKRNKAIRRYGEALVDLNELETIGFTEDGEIVCGNSLNPANAKLLRLRLEYFKSGADRQKVLNEIQKLVEEHPEIRMVKYAQPLEYYRITDVTDRVNEIMKEAETTALAELEGKQNGLAKYLLYYRYTKPEGPYDIKLWEEFQAHPIYIYDGEIVDRDVLGNIIYGYLGAAIDIDRYLMYSVPGAVQILKGSSSLDWGNSFFDDPRDQQRIRQGEALYYSRKGQ